MKLIDFQGKHGSVEKVDINILTSLKRQFQDQNDLLNVMRQYGETAFQRNDNEEALNVFSFIASVTDYDTALHKEVSKKSKAISNAFSHRSLIYYRYECVLSRSYGVSMDTFRFLFPVF